MWFTGTKNAATAAQNLKVNHPGNNGSGAHPCSNVGANGKLPSKNTATGEPYTAIKLLKEALVAFVSLSSFTFMLAFVSDAAKYGVIP